MQNSEDSRQDDTADRSSVLEQVQRYLASLDEHDAEHDADHATQEDFLIIDALMQVVSAARRKGYSEELITTLLHSLFTAS